MKTSATEKCTTVSEHSAITAFLELLNRWPAVHDFRSNCRCYATSYQRGSSNRAIITTTTFKTRKSRPRPRYCSLIFIRAKFASHWMHSEMPSRLKAALYPSSPKLLRRSRRPRYQQAIFRSSTRLSIPPPPVCTCSGGCAPRSDRVRSVASPKNASRPAACPSVRLAPSQRSVVRRSESADGGDT